MNDIFKNMQAKVGCEYISDLPSYKRKVWQEMKRLNPADYEEKQLEDFSKYVFGMSYQPQLQPFQSRVQKKRRKSNALPQRPLQKQASQSRQALSKSVRYLLVLLIEKQPSLHSKYIGRM